MEKLPSKAKCIVIGAGIVGNSIVYHLSKLGWNDLQHRLPPFQTRME